MRLLVDFLSGPFIRFPLYCLLATFCAFGGLFWMYVLILYHRGIRRPPGVRGKLDKHNFFADLFYRLPMQMAWDFLNTAPDFFRPQGCIIYTGRQGNGKTIAMVQHTMELQQIYPACNVISNLDYKYQHEKLKHWKQLINYKNGIHGVIVMMDEMQNWFASSQARDFPPQMLEIITQNRKNRRLIQGTAQSFNRLAKPIREQATEVRRCVTLFGALTIVHRVEPELDSTGEVIRWKHRGIYYFVHTQRLRNSYDTWAVVESLKKSGFQSGAGVVGGGTDTQVAVRVGIQAATGKRK